jgi:hypothetical protein
MYHVNKIKNHDLYKTIFHDLFELKQKHWNELILKIWNIVFIVCYAQNFWISRAERNDTRAKIMHRAIRASFYEDWTLNQIKYVEKNYRKLFSVIQNRKMKLLKNQQSNRNFSTFSIKFSSFQFSIVSILALVLVFVFAFVSISIRFLIVDQKSVN